MTFSSGGHGEADKGRQLTTPAVAALLGLLLLGEHLGGTALAGLVLIGASLVVIR